MLKLISTNIQKKFTNNNTKCQLHQHTRIYMQVPNY